MCASSPLPSDQVVHCLPLQVGYRQSSAKQLLWIGDGREGEGEGCVQADEEGGEEGVGG